VYDIYEAVLVREAGPSACPCTRSRLAKRLVSRENRRRAL
jgi:hypothetical protein